MGELAWDPLTGESLVDQDNDSVDSGRESDVRRLSTSSTSEESASSRKSSMRKSSHLADILELADHIIPEQCVLECFIDPFTGQFITKKASPRPVTRNWWPRPRRLQHLLLRAAVMPASSCNGPNSRGTPLCRGPSRPRTNSKSRPLSQRRS